MEASENIDKLQIEDLYKQKIEPLLQIDLQSLPVETKNLFTQVGVSDKTVDLIIASGNNKIVLVMQGLPNLIDALGIESVITKWDQLVDIGAKAGETAYDLFKAGLPGLVKSLGKDFLESHWDILVDVGKCTGPLAWAVYQHVIPSWKENFGEEYLETNIQNLTSGNLITQDNIEAIEKDGLILPETADNDETIAIDKNEICEDTEDGIVDETSKLKSKTESKQLQSKRGSVNAEIYSLIKERGELIDKVSELQKKTATMEQKLVEMSKERDIAKSELRMLVKNLKLLVEENEPFTLSEDVRAKIDQENTASNLAVDDQNFVNETKESNLEVDIKDQAGNVDDALTLLRKDLLKASSINKKLRSDLAQTKPSIKSKDDLGS